jgi:hypothetical protein
MMAGVLERVQTVFQSYNVNLPSRQYWTVGTPVIDCEQVVVSFIQMYLGSPGDEAQQPQRCNVPRSAVLAVSIARQIPVVGMNGRPPSPKTIELASESATIDAYVLMDCVKEFDMWDNTGYGLGVIATVDVGEAQGGFQTVNMQLTMAIP